MVLFVVASGCVIPTESMPTSSTDASRQPDSAGVRTWTVFFSPSIDISGCFGSPMVWNDQAFSSDAGGAFEAVWSGGEPGTMRVQGTLNARNIHADLTCLKGTDAIGSFDAQATTPGYQGTYEFDGRQGSVRVVEWSDSGPSPTPESDPTPNPSSSTGPSVGDFRLLSPKKDFTNAKLPIEFIWSESTGASGYEFQIATSSTFGQSVFVRRTVTDESTIIGDTLVPGVVYYWQVFAGTGGGNLVASNAPTWFSIPLTAGPSPKDIAISHDGRTAYVINGDASGNMTIVSLDDGLVTASIPTGGPGSSITLTTDGEQALVVNGKLVVVDLAGRQVAARYGSKCGGLAFIYYDVEVAGPDQAVVTDSPCGNLGIRVMSVAQGGGTTVKTGNQPPVDVAVTPNGESVLVATFSAGSFVPRVNLSTLAVDRIAGVGASYAVAVSPDGLSALVAADDADGLRLKRLDLRTNTVAKTLSIGGGQRWNSIEYSPDGTQAAIQSSFHLTIIDTSTDEPLVRYDATGGAVTISPDGTKVYGPDEYNHIIRVFPMPGKVAIIIDKNETDSRPPAQGSWAKRADLPVPRTDSAGATIGGKMYVVGGTTRASAAMVAYDPVADNWTAQPSPIGNYRAHAAAVAIGTKLYLLGGCESGGEAAPDCRTGTTNRTSLFASSTGAWTEHAPMTTRRFQVAAAAIDGKIYVAGGVGACPPCPVHNNLEVYDPATDTWTSLPGMPAARATPFGAAIGGLFYVAGGGDGSQNRAELYVYDPTNATWSTKTSMPYPGRFGASGVIGEKWFLVIGEQASMMNSRDVLSYDPATDAWNGEAPIPTGRYVPAAAVVGRVLIVASGGPNNSLVTSVEAFRPG